VMAVSGSAAASASDRLLGLLPTKRVLNYLNINAMYGI
jgi:hypothetical protein